MVELVRQNLKINKLRYKKIEKKILNNIDIDIQVEHVGSTAIPRMYGKNIIDILVGVNTSDEFEYVANKLKKLGFCGSENSRDSIYQFFASTEEETKDGDVHIHLVMKNTERFNDFIVLRNYLLEKPEEAKDYSAFKIMLIKNGTVERKDYKKIKSEYVSKLIERARKFYK